jgi:hypothetical protein
MSNSSLKKLTIILLVSVVILLLANIFITKYAEKDKRPKNREVLSGIEIDKKFNQSLKNYGFLENWIVKKKLKKISGDSLYSSYSVSVPKNVPIQMLILEMKNLFWEDDVEVYAEEIYTGKSSLIKLSSDNKLKLAAELVYNDDIKREFGNVAFLVSELPDEDEEQLSQLLLTPELFYAVLVPGSESKKNINKLIKSEKRFVVLLNDKISELDYKLSSSFSEQRILRSLKEIVTDYNSAAFFIVDEKSDLYESQNYAYIQTQLNKRGITLVPTSRFIQLYSNGSNADLKFQDFILTVNKTDEKILLVTTEEYLALVKLIPAYRKIGYKFISAGDIILKK